MIKYAVEQNAHPLLSPGWYPSQSDSQTFASNYMTVLL